VSMSGAISRQYPYRVIKAMARIARLSWLIGWPLGRITHARACWDGGPSVGFDVGLDCVVTCLECGRAFQVGATLDQADNGTLWLPDYLCGKMPK